MSKGNDQLKQAPEKIQGIVDDKEPHESQDKPENNLLLPDEPLGF